MHTDVNVSKSKPSGGKVTLESWSAAFVAQPLDNQTCIICSSSAVSGHNKILQYAFFGLSFVFLFSGTIKLLAM